SSGNRGTFPKAAERSRCPGTLVSAILRLSVPGSPTRTTAEIPMRCTLGLLVLCAATLPPARAGEPVALFDGKDTAKWYTFLRDHGKDKDPNGNFSLCDGVLRIAGQEFGALITRDEYANYEVRVEYAWGGKVWPPREKTARDSGLLVHCTGPDGA